MMTKDKGQREVETLQDQPSRARLRSRKRVKYRENKSGNSSSYCTKIDSLPIEVLIEIFQYLPHAERFCLERVCKKWQNVARDSWRDVRLISIEPVNEKPNTFPKRKTLFTVADEVTIKTDYPAIIRSVLSRCGKYIKTFDYESGSREKFQSAVAIVNEYCQNIESVSLRVPIKINDRGLSKLFEINKKLNCFECEDRDFAKNLIMALPVREWKILNFEVETDYEDCREKLILLIGNSHSLKEFKIDRWSSDLIEAISQHESLEVLHFNQRTCNLEKPWVYYEPEEMQEYCIDFSERFSQHCRNLRELRLEGAEFTMKTFEAISPFQQLECLQLDYLRITDKVLIRLTNFKILELKMCTGYTEVGLVEMIKNSEFLEELDISGLIIDPRMFIQLVNEINGHTKLKKIAVSMEIVDEVMEIFEGTSIKIVDDMDFAYRF